MACNAATISIEKVKTPVSWALKFTISLVCGQAGKNGK